MIIKIAVECQIGLINCRERQKFDSWN